MRYDRHDVAGSVSSPAEPGRKRGGGVHGVEELTERERSKLAKEDFLEYSCVGSGLQFNKKGEGTP
jgi:hypothetical protein